MTCGHQIFAYMGADYWEDGKYEQRHRCIDCGHQELDVPSGAVMIGHAPGECDVCDRNAKILPGEQVERWKQLTAARRGEL